MFYSTSKAVTITVCYTTRPAIAPGKRCTNSVREEVRALISQDNLALMADHHTQPDLHKEVGDGLRLLPLPSPDSNSLLTANVSGEDGGVCPQFVNTLSFHPSLPSLTTAHLSLPYWLSPFLSSSRGHAPPPPPFPAPTQPGDRQESTCERTGQRPAVHTASNTPK